MVLKVGEPGMTSTEKFWDTVIRVENKQEAGASPVCTNNPVEQGHTASDAPADQVS